MIYSDFDPAEGLLYLWRHREDKLKPADPEKVAGEYRDAIQKAGVRRAAVVNEYTDFANALARLPGFAIEREGGGEFARPWPSGVKSRDMTGVREAGPADEPLMFDILKAVDLIYDDYRVDLQRVFAPGGYHVVISEGGKDAALGSVNHGNGVAWISYVAVLPPAQGRGLGRRIMEILMVEKDKVPLERYELATGGSPAALRLFRSFGFERISPVEWRVKYERPGK